MNDHLYQIYVAPEFIEEEEIPISDVITWCIENLRHSTTNAIFLTEGEMDYITYEVPFLDIINEENDSILGRWEDTMIYDQDVKRRIYFRLEQLERTLEGPGAELVNRFNKLLGMQLRPINICI